MRSTVSEVEFVAGPKNCNGSHAAADGLPRRSWQIGRKIPKYRRHINFIPERLSRRPESNIG